MSKEGKTRILLAEDTAVGRKIIAHFLADEGYEVTSVGDGRAVLDSLAGTSCDLVVMDCMMPVMDGFEASRAIRRGDAGAEHTDIPIIAISALESERNQEKCQEAGMDEYLPKPVDHVVLAERIEALLARRLDAEEKLAQLERQSQQRELLRTLDEWSPGFMDSIIDQFLEDVPAEIASLKAAIEREDLQTMRHLAHRLRGSADVVSAGGVSKRARALEQACAARNLALARQLGPALLLELQAIGDELGGAP